MTARILVVDDEPDLEILLVQKFRRQIRDGEVNFLFAHDGAEALAKLEEDRNIDMVVTDINMPRMDGLSFLSKLMKFHPMPVVVVSSQAQEGSRAAMSALQLGAVGIVPKPGS